MTEETHNSIGAIGVYGAMVSSLVIASALLLIFAPTKGSTIELVISSHIRFFVKMFGLMVLFSLVTIPMSFLSDGLRRGFGIALGIANFFIVVEFLGAACGV